MPTKDWETSNNRVLLVDDDELYLETMMAELEDRGFAVRGFLDGPSLFKELDRGLEADALLLDWTLPSMPGINVLSGVRDRGIDVPVAFLTGRALVDYEHIALNRGAIDFIDKMRGADIIAKRLNRMVAGGRRRLPATAREPAPP
jgi:two-component system, OmpR family, response regulator ChvI